MGYYSIVVWPVTFWTYFTDLFIWLAARVNSFFSDWRLPRGIVFPRCDGFSAKNRWCLGFNFQFGTSPRLMLYYHCVRDTSWSVIFSTREEQRSAQCGWFFQTCFGSAASAFEIIELAYFHCAIKENFSVSLAKKGFTCDVLWRTCEHTTTNFSIHCLN